MLALACSSQAAPQSNGDPSQEPKVYEYEYYDDTVPVSPFVNPYDPSHQNVSISDL